MKKFYEEPTLQAAEFKTEDPVATLSWEEVKTPASGFEQ